MAELIIKNISKKFGNSIIALKNISLNIISGEILSVLGESGSGKSTLMRIIAGFEYADSGSITLAGKTISDEKTYIKPEQRKIGMVFQDYALFPHLTVAGNIAFGIKSKSKQKTKERVEYFLKLVDMPEYERRYPHTLSGGQLQRVALARALASEPDLLLLDEPLSNLDDNLKDKLREEIRNILKQTATTAILVTHDIYDALKIADKIAVMSSGELLQSDTAINLYRQPNDEFVASIFSDYNVYDVKVHLNRFTLFNCEFNCTNETADGHYKLLIYPQDIKISNDSKFAARVIARNFNITNYEIIAQINETPIKFYEETPINIDTEINISLSPEKFVFIKDKSEQLKT